MSNLTIKTSDSTKLLARIGDIPRSVDHLFSITGWDRFRFNDALNTLLARKLVKIDMIAGTAALRRTTPKENPNAEFDRIDDVATSLHALLKEKQYEMQNIRDVYERWLGKEGKLCCTETWCDVTAALLLLSSRSLIDHTGREVALRVPIVEWEEVTGGSKT